MATVLERPRFVEGYGYSEISDFIVEAGIPLPPRTRNLLGRPTRYPFAHMRPGDSFEVQLSAYDAKNPTIGKLQSALGNAARAYAKTHNPTATFATRRASDTSVRIWRTA